MTDKRASASTVRGRITELRKEWGWSPSDIINLLRGGGTSAKGGEFERDICRLLSKWWTDGARDDIFWRTSGSGARAHVRHRAGAGTAGQYGDIAATDPIGAPLIDVFTIELKRGYSEYTVHDLLDKTPSAGIQEWDRFFAQAIESHEQAGSLSWLMITRRDRRVPLVWLPVQTFHELRHVGAFSNKFPVPLSRMKLSIRNLDNGENVMDAYNMHLDSFLEGVKQNHIKELAL